MDVSHSSSANYKISNKYYEEYERIFGKGDGQRNTEYSSGGREMEELRGRRDVEDVQGEDDGKRASS